MSHADNKVGWCLRKADKELKAGDEHRGLVRMKPDVELARAHVKKAEHNLKAISDFKRMGYSDWSASAAFYSVYHCFLAIAAKSGYESRNQECTFALIRSLIGKKEIDLDVALVDQVSELGAEGKHESATVVEVRESGQYGVKLSLEAETFDRLLKLAKVVLDKTKEILQE